jgi:hypothetical protein
MNYWGSAESSGVGLGWGHIFMGCAYSHQDDGLGELISTI